MRSYFFTVLVSLAAAVGLASVSRGYCLRMQLEAQARQQQQWEAQVLQQQMMYFGGGSYGGGSARREAAASRAQPSKSEKRLKNLERQYNRAQGFDSAAREAKAQSLYNQAVYY